jgi:hypothetical protein
VEELNVLRETLYECVDATTAKVRLRNLMFDRDPIAPNHKVNRNLS